MFRSVRVFYFVMRNKHENSNSGTGAGTLTNDVRNTSNTPLSLTERFNDNSRKNFYDTIETFFDMGGVTEPVETITDMLNKIFTAKDECETDEAGKPVPLYIACGEHYVSELIFRSTAMINFFVSLKENWDKLPENPVNQQNPLTPFKTFE